MYSAFDAGSISRGVSEQIFEHDHKGWAKAHLADQDLLGSSCAFGRPAALVPGIAADNMPAVILPPLDPIGVAALNVARSREIPDKGLRNRWADRQRGNPLNLTRFAPA